MDEDALANGLIIGNIPIVVPPTPYALVPPLDVHLEDNSWKFGLVIPLSLKKGSLKLFRCLTIRSFLGRC